jgi:transcriptional regulator
VDNERRALVLGLLAGTGALAMESTSAAGVEAGQEGAAPDPSLYIPKAHLVEDRKFLHDFMDEFAFVDLVTTSPTLRITHIPSMLDRTAGRYGTIFGHISAQNLQRQTLDGAHSAIAVFKGPHGYVSPSWYAKQDVVPTWNFSVVHASGTPRAVTGKDETLVLLSRLIAKFERAVGGTYDFSKLPEGYVAGMLQGIMPFRMEIDALEGKFKLGQERSEGDRQGILPHLQKQEYRERSLYDLTEAFYRNPPK